MAQAGDTPKPPDILDIFKGLNIGSVPGETVAAAALNFGAAWFAYETELLKVDPELATKGRRRLEKLLDRLGMIGDA